MQNDKTAAFVKIDQESVGKFLTPSKLTVFQSFRIQK